MWIHFTQQESVDYLPLRWGLGYIKYKTAKEVNAIIKSMGKCTPPIPELCPKMYTTRLRPLKPHLTYVVVRGSRYSAKPVKPKIEFRVGMIWLLDLRNAMYSASDGLNWATIGCLDEPSQSFPELDLGYKDATWDDLVEKLLELNKKATLDTPFYINKLEPIPIC